MTFVDKGYARIKNALSKETCELATQYVLFEQMNDVDGKHIKQFNRYEPNSYASRADGTHGVYGDSLMESILQFLKPVAEKHSELKLIPTYSYYRIYKNGHVLLPHRDRPSCEVSLSLTLGYHYTDADEDYRWPLIMNHVPIAAEIGEAILYRGCKHEHERRKLDVGENSFHIQVFLHYVNADGPYAEKCKYDGRPSIGIRKENIKNKI
tara:strand:+ start:6012 stop:6638 length:627 start_codon:yes stop_codon:yes gene_type:complete